MTSSAYTLKWLSPPKVGCGSLLFQASLASGGVLALGGVPLGCWLRHTLLPFPQDFGSWVFLFVLLVSISGLLNLIFHLFPTLYLFLTNLPPAKKN